MTTVARAVVEEIADPRRGRFDTGRLGALAVPVWFLRLGRAPSS
ncbi:hypothetical protein SAMN04488107_3450 [Geodermatophilus saharensis]|uniref:Uncharacterized protein n=1 Tax=Geodermatophilus saharensis TaxID=1137994 RepID=A0A239GJS7_9ACTN|nr:hypothetical protein [Geodermatophilus saharensis]SNS69390.1 hypothetical protein SAMN04488107_3450 [Geodermatophilus saharensis]